MLIDSVICIRDDEGISTSSYVDSIASVNCFCNFARCFSSANVVITNIAVERLNKIDITVSTAAVAASSVFPRPV